MYNIGDFVFDTVEKANVQILENIQVWGYTSYKVFNTATGRVYKANEKQLCTTGTMELDENYLRYIVLLSKIKNETSSGLLSSLSSGVIPLPHQLHVLNRTLEYNNIRYILADEVGLGKTIEAGMVIKELKARGLIRRILVVCPTGLVSQWSVEMQEKFHEKFRVILPSDFDTIRRLSDSNDVYGQFDQVISPMDSIKPVEKHAGWSEERIKKYNQDRIEAIINSGWDLIIIDEAHRIAGSSSDVARYKLGHLLSQASPYLLLLTATPHNGKTEPFLRLVRLLDEEAFPNYKSIVKEQVAPYLIRTEKREAIDNNGNLLFKKRHTHLVELSWDERHSMQCQLYEMVSNYVSRTYNEARKKRKKNMCLIFLMIIMQRMVTSSTAAIRKSLERRLEILQGEHTHASTMREGDLEERDIENGDTDAIEAVSLERNSEIEELKAIIATAKQAEYQHYDVKVDELFDTIDMLQGQDPGQKIILFTEFVGTQVYLQKLLEDRGYRVSILNGSMDMEERNNAFKEFRSSSNIFISTDAGGEGLNLQFANIIINYDLPWNPMKIEQRCGRADRIGQQRDVHIYNFIISDTVESRVREVLEQKLSVIMKELGVDKYSDVLDSQVAECNFTEAYMSSIGHVADIEENIYYVEKEMRQQAANAIKYRKILHEEKDLNQLVGKESNFDVDSALRQMISCYESWQGNDLTLIDKIAINDEMIVHHLRSSIMQDHAGQVLSVGIDNFPNEAGFFMLWELSVSDENQDKHIVPVFVNDAFILRPMAGNRIMDVFLDRNSRLICHMTPRLSEDVYHQLQEISMEFAYNLFVELRDKQAKRNQEQYKKYKYAISLRRETTERIGIDNIRRSRLDRLNQEERELEAVHERVGAVLPDFRLVALIRLEA